jgi:hypothetical protein
VAGDRRPGGRRGGLVHHGCDRRSAPPTRWWRDYYRQGIEINKTLADKKMRAGQQGRNHAATPSDDVPLK